MNHTIGWPHRIGQTPPSVTDPPLCTVTDPPSVMDPPLSPCSEVPHLYLPVVPGTITLKAGTKPVHFICSNMADNLN